MTVRLGEERERLTAARAAVTAAEQADRLAMAEAIGAGRDPVSDEKQIAKARAQVATCERRVEAAKLALADAQAALGQQVEEQRQAWSRRRPRSSSRPVRLVCGRSARSSRRCGAWAARTR